MSGDLLVRDADRLARRRALWALLVIAFVAAVLVVLMAFFLGTSKHHGDKLPLATEVSLAPVTSTAVSPGAPVRRSASPRRSARGSSAPDGLGSPGTSPPPESCSGAAPCVLPGDPGQLVVALNALRAQHGLPAVAGAATHAAQSCAVHDGDRGSCPSTYYWEPVGAQDGRQVLGKIVGNGGSSFLLSPSLKTVAVGWAYVPGSKTYECTLAAA